MKATYLRSLFERLHISFFVNNMKCVVSLISSDVVNWKIYEFRDFNRELKTETCSICYNEKLIDCSIMPCNGHTCCEDCAYRLMEFVNRTCPFCRTFITSINHYK